MRPSYGHDSKPSGIIPVFVIAALDSIQTDYVKKLERKVASLTKRLQDAAPDDESVSTERETKEQEVERFLDQKQHLLEKIAQLELEAGAEEFEPYSDKNRDQLAAISKGE